MLTVISDKKMKMCIRRCAEEESCKLHVEKVDFGVRQSASPLFYGDGNISSEI